MPVNGKKTQPNASEFRRSLALTDDPGHAVRFQPWWMDVAALGLLGLGVWLCHRQAPPLTPDPPALAVPPIIPAS